MRRSEPFWKRLLFMGLIFLMGCLSSGLQEPSLPSPRNVQVQMERRKPEQKTPVPEYHGKYRQDPRFLHLKESLHPLKEKSVQCLARRLGMLCEEQEKVVVSFRDWTPQCPGSVFSSPFLSEKEKKIEIVVVLEPFVTRQENFALSFPKRFSEALLKMRNPSLSDFPAWILEGAIQYAIAEESEALEEFAVKMLEETRPLEKVVKGLAHTQLDFPELEGYLAFLFLEGYYTDGEVRLKKWFDAVFSQGKDWEEYLVNIFSMPFFEFQEKARQFALGYLGSRFRGPWVAYRKALRFYLKQEYLDATAQFKKLLLQFPDSFMAQNLHFWLAMSYYQVKQYEPALGYFQKAIEKRPHLCSHFPLAHYRMAFCHYRQERMAKAIVQWSDFVRDFPHHPFQANAQFFLAQALHSQSDYKRAFQEYASFISKNDGHARLVEALIEAGRIAEKAGWFNEARRYHRRLLSHPGASEKQKKQSEEALFLIEAVEKKGPSPEMAHQLEQALSRFDTLHPNERKNVLDEMARIGKLSLPWIDRLISSSARDSLEPILEALCKMEEPSSTAHFMMILKKNTDLAQKALLGIVRLSIPAEFLGQIVESGLEDLASAEKSKIEKDLRSILWDSSPELRKRFPDLLKKLNGTPEEQSQMIETMALQAGEEQIPVLCRLSTEASGVGQRRALSNLISWSSPMAKPVFERLLDDPLPDIRVMAIAGASSLGDRSPIFEKGIAQKDHSPEVRKAALIALGSSDEKKHFLPIVYGLGDTDLSVRESAKRILSSKNAARVMEGLQNAFLEEAHPAYFYTGIIEILEKLTGRGFSYRPDMTKEERGKLISSIRNRQSQE